MTTNAHRRTLGPGRLLAAVYTLFAVSAGARAIFQIATKFSHAPAAYTLSALAAAIYLLAALCFTRPSGASWRTAVTALSVEFAGVVIVGTLSVVQHSWFPDTTVWSDYGVGYGFVPVILPIIGLLWLRRPATRIAFGEVTSGVAQRR
jgi:hypothetical protein